MSKKTRDLIDMVKDESSGGITPPGLRDGKFWTDIAAELKQQMAHGSHEVAALLYRGDAFVMYPRTNEGKEEPQLGLPQEAQKEMERGGMEM